MMIRDFRQMQRQTHARLAGLVPIGVGVLWLVSGWDSGAVVGVLACVPGVVLTGAGASLLLWPGDRHINHWLTLIAAVSVLFDAALGWLFAPLETLLLALGGVACVGLGGFMALWQDAVPAAIPARRFTLALAFKAALDEGVIAFFLACSDIPRGRAVVRDRDELAQLHARIADEGWADQPEALLGTPRAPEKVTVERARAGGQTFDWLAFDSAYAPPTDLPGASRWQNYRRNQRAYARVFCHGGSPRPWLMCIHGYRMGMPGMDFSLFDIGHLHHALGMNVIMPILPLHGTRRITRLSGGQFLDGPMTNLLHAEVQTLWDLRRCLNWLRADKAAETVGVLGYSLGGYNAALLAAFEPELACVIAGIPLSDIGRAVWRHVPRVDLRYIEANGVSREWLGQLMAPVSPLQLPVRVPRERRYIFAATGDQLVPPEQPLALWQHWEEPGMHWYNGSHMSVRRQGDVAAFVDRALLESGMVAPDQAIAGAPG